MVTDESRYIKRKLYVLNYAKQVGDVKKACRYFGIARSTFYEWRNQYKNGGEEGKNKMSTLNIIRNKLLFRIFAVVKRQTPYVDLTMFAA